MHSLMPLSGNVDSNRHKVIKTEVPKKVKFESMCDSVPETGEVMLDEKGGNFKFTNKHSGINIYVMLDSTADTRCRIMKASKDI